MINKSKVNKKIFKKKTIFETFYFQSSLEKKSNSDFDTVLFN